MATAILLSTLRRNRKKTAGCVSLASTYAYASFVESKTNVKDQNCSNSKISSELPRQYDKITFENYWSERPISVGSRLANIGKEMVPLIWKYFLKFKWNSYFLANDKHDPLKKVLLQRELASDLKDALTRLGPAFVKGGQQLSIRPDLVPPPFLKELQKLCDSVEPVSDDIAMEMLEKELAHNSNGKAIDSFADVTLVASASLGQVYKAKIKGTDDYVAIKIQRPDMERRVSLDLFLLHKLSVMWDVVTTTFTAMAPFHEDLFDNFARASYKELDYECEASNQEKFKNEFSKRKSRVFIPNVYREFTSHRVITTEWVNGVKLADAPKSQIRELIPVGVELFMTQLLDIGAFHADPHPGNLYVTDDGILCLLDFGLCAEVDAQARDALTAAIVHLLTGDFKALVTSDVKKLGFLPHDLDTSELQPLLTTILTEGLLKSGSDLRNRKRKLMEISNELNEIFFDYPFSVPPFFALVTRGLGLLEGIALSGDPDFDIFKASAPYARRRAVKIFGAHGWNEMNR